MAFFTENIQSNVAVFGDIVDIVEHETFATLKFVLGIFEIMLSAGVFPDITELESIDYSSIRWSMSLIDITVDIYTEVVSSITVSSDVNLVEMYSVAVATAMSADVTAMTFINFLASTNVEFVNKFVFQLAELKFDSSFGGAFEAFVPAVTQVLKTSEFFTEETLATFQKEIIFSQEFASVLFVFETISYGSRYTKLE